MAVKSSGALSLTTDIVGEFGGVAPHSLSEYYGGGTYVPAGANPGIATSGQINMGSFYDAVAATVLTISSNTNNYDIGAAAIAAGGDKSTPVILTINAGVTVGSTSSGTAAMFTGTGWSSGTTINITNNGSIVGASGSNSSAHAVGGVGGAGGRAANCGNTNGGSGSSGANGSGSADAINNGGNAFEHSQTGDNNLSVVFDTAGTRTGGSGGTKTITGGGGAGGGGSPYFTSAKFIGGGGGGGGASSGSGGAGGCGQHGSGAGGSTGGSTTGGSGGAGGYWCCTTIKGGNGGSGGGSGSAGSAGVNATNRTRSAGGGGAGGSTGYAYGSTGTELAGNTGQII